jgi:putative glutamine amidotransferase
MTTPRIGVSAARARAADGRLLDGAPHAYADAVTAAGGLPLLLARPRPQLAPEVVATIDGLLLTGGSDVGPENYGCAAQPETAGVDAERDRAELALVKAALARGLPILGICRGAQLLNVALGGSLVQHLAHHSELAHDQWDRRHEEVHQVRVGPGSVLAGALGRLGLPVNSAHHQGVDRLAEGLTAVAWAEDGLVEGFEDGTNNLLAVQWHPELLTDRPGHAGLFTWLVRQAATESR